MVYDSNQSLRITRERDGGYAHGNEDALLIDSPVRTAEEERRANERMAASGWTFADGKLVRA